MNIPSRVAKRSRCHPGPAPCWRRWCVGMKPRSAAFASLSAKRSRENALFCQCSVQKVEPILSPEQLVAVDVRWRAEDLAIDRLFGQAVVRGGDFRSISARGERCGVESLLARDCRYDIGLGDVELLHPHRAHQRGGKLQRLVGAVFERSKNAPRRQVPRHGKELWLHIERQIEEFAPTLQLQ